MQKALETYIIDLMRNFNEFGILDSDGKPFEPNNVDLNNPAHFAQLKPFELGLDRGLSAEMRSHASLPFYDPACDGINQNPELKAQLAASNDNPVGSNDNAALKTKWVNATQHAYPVNAGKAMWNIALKTLTELRGITEAAQKGVGALLSKLKSVNANKEALQTYLQSHSAYLNSTTPTEPEAIKQGLVAYGVPVVVDQRTLAFAKSSLKFLNITLLCMPDPFKEVNDKILIKDLIDWTPGIILNPILELIKAKQKKSILGFQLAQPRLLESICLYEARTSTQTSASVEAIHEKLGTLSQIALHARTYPANFYLYFENELQRLSDDSRTSIEARIEALKALEDKLNAIDRLLELKPTFQFKQEYPIKIYSNDHDTTEYYSRVDIATGTREECETTLAHLYSGKNIQQIIEAQKTLRINFQQTQENLNSILTAKQNEKNNAFTLQKALIEKNQRLTATLQEKKRLQVLTTLELQNFNGLHHDIENHATQTIARSEPKLHDVKQKLLDSQSLYSTVTSGLTTVASYSLSWFSTAPPAPENQAKKELSLEELTAKKERLEQKLRPANQTATRIQKERASIRQRLSTLEHEIAELDNTISANNSAIERHQIAIDEKTAVIEAQIREYITELDEKKQNQLATLRTTKTITMAQFEIITAAYLKELRAIYNKYNILKQSNPGLWDSLKLSKSKNEFEQKYLNYPLTNPNIQQAVELLSTDYKSFHSKWGIPRYRKRKNAEKFALAFIRLIDTFSLSQTPQGKIEALIQFKNICDKFTLPRNTSVAVGIILGILISIVVAGLLISGWGIFFAAGATAILSATLLTQIVTGAGVYILGILGMSIGWAAGHSATPVITDNYLKLGNDCTKAYETLEGLTNSLTAQSKSLELELNQKAVSDSVPGSFIERPIPTSDTSGVELIEFLPAQFEEACVFGK